MKKKIFLVVLIVLILIAGLFILTGCGNNENTESISNNSENTESVNDGSMENNNFILKDHKGYYNEAKDKYIVEGTIVNKTDQTFENKVIMIKVIAEDGTSSYYASCTIEKLEPHGEIKIVADTPYLDHNSKEIVRYELRAW